jgi:hypothetical protein
MHFEIPSGTTTHSARYEIHALISAENADIDKDGRF